MTRIYFIEQDARVLRPDELARLIQGRSAQTLADELGLAHTTVWRALRKFGLRPAWTAPESESREAGR